MMRGKSLDFSFSGLKTALAIHLQKHGVPAGQELADLCASFQAAVLDQLVRKTGLALEQSRLRTLVVAGGVACNRGLRAALQKKCDALAVRLVIPSPALLTTSSSKVWLDSADLDGDGRIEGPTVEDGTVSGAVQTWADKSGCR